MKYNKLLFVGTLLVSLISIISILLKQDKSSVTKEQVEASSAREEEKRAHRIALEEWMNEIHGSHPDWRIIEEKNQLEAMETSFNLKRRKAGYRMTATSEAFAEGMLKGTWNERGSDNISGRIVNVEMNPATKIIYALSDAGFLFKGNLQGENWTSLNDQRPFEGSQMVLYTNAGVDRLVVADNNKLFYSDDMGFSWNLSLGLSSNIYKIQKVVAISTNRKIIIAFACEGTSGAIYKSIDGGKNFTLLQSLTTNWFSSKLHSPQNSDRAYFMSSSGTLYYITAGSALLYSNASSIFSAGCNSMAGIKVGTVNTLYVETNGGKIYKSINDGASWTLQSNRSCNDWIIFGLFPSITSADKLYFSCIDLHKSSDGALTWSAQPGNYYSNINNIHPDIMEIEEYLNPSTGTSITLIANDGGLHKSEDGMATTFNIGKNGLNVSQYYDVATFPHGIVAGAQDQGFQINYEDSLGILGFQQTDNGDHGSIATSNDGVRLWNWVVYQLRSRIYIPASKKYSSAISWTPTGTIASRWMPPMVADPDNPNRVYIGGSSLVASGAKIISAIMGIPFVMSELPYNFEGTTGEKITALTISSLNHDHWYVGSSAGRFFYSLDRGINWTQTSGFASPAGYSNHPNIIYASSITSGLLFVGGSGYGLSSSVYKSDDNGLSFVPVNDGLPETSVYSLDANKEETLLFAATASGPYVYVVATNKWYSMLGTSAPIVKYFDVQVLDDKSIVRFGTYGRGIWDFTMDPVVTSVSNALAAPQLKLYPNPASNFISLDWNNMMVGKFSVSISNMHGQVIKKLTFQNNGVSPLEINISDLPHGMYVLEVINTGNRRVSEKFYKD